MRAHKASFESRRYNANDSDLSVVWVTTVLPHTRLYACVYMCVLCIRVSRVRAHMPVTAKGVEGKGGRMKAEHWKRNYDDAAWIRCTEVYDNDTGIERTRRLSPTPIIVSPPEPPPSPVCLSRDPSWTRRSEIALEIPLLVNARMHSVHRYILNLSGASQPFLPLFLRLHDVFIWHQGTALCFN